jgi:DNA-binding Lrp family transcriptional regulator
MESAASQEFIIFYSSNWNLVLILFLYCCYKQNFTNTRIRNIYKTILYRYSFSMSRIDETNRKILDILQHDASMTNQELASRIGLSPASTLERVRKLEQSGMIKRYVALLDEKKLEKHIRAYIFVTMKEHCSTSIQRFNDEIQHLPEVLECCRLAGEKDYLLKVVVDNIEDFEIFTRTRLTTIPGIDKTSSSIVLASIVDRTDFPL